MVLGIWETLSSIGGFLLTVTHTSIVPWQDKSSSLQIFHVILRARLSEHLFVSLETDGENPVSDNGSCDRVKSALRKLTSDPKRKRVPQKHFSRDCAIFKQDRDQIPVCV